MPRNSSRVINAESPGGSRAEESGGSGQRLLNGRYSRTAKEARLWLTCPSL
jgi:hypothetical protein